MKLEVGMYVRTELGIAKYLGKASYENPFTRKIVETDIDEFDNLAEELWSGDVPNWVFECDTEDIVLKASHNIIDLIEVGDYVNGHQVYEVDRQCCRITLNGGSYGEAFRLTYLRPALGKNMGIKTIVTKEQFEAMAYRIGE